MKELLIKYADYIGRHARLLLLLCVLSWLSLMDIPVSPVFALPEWCRMAYPIVVAVFKSVVLLTLLYPCFRMAKLKWVVPVFCGCFAVLALTNAVAYRYYGMGITRKLILIFAQTTRKETSEFIPGLWSNVRMIFSSPGFYAVIVTFVLLMFAIGRISRRISGSVALSLAVIGMIAFVGFSMRFNSGRTAHILTARIVKYSHDVWQANKEYEALLRNKRPLPYKESVSSRQLAGTVVVVIGESAHRRHHSLYGYKLPTTPYLDAMADSLVVFTDAIGSSAATSGNMERILSFKEDDMTYGDGLKYPLVVDLFNEMGYKTFWLSNQERTGTVSNTSGIMTMNADVVNYVGAENSEDALTAKYDGALLAPFEAAMKEDCPKMIFLHLLGSHTEYKTRYPEEYWIFSGEHEKRVFGFEWFNDENANRRAEYDNSIRYTDSLLGNLLDEIRKKAEPALLVYLSDHGEEVYDFGPYTGRNDNTVQVPFIVYANEAYSASNPELMKRLRHSADRPLSTANLVHMLITLTGGIYRLYDPTLDITSDAYQIRPRYVDEHIWKYDANE